MIKSNDISANESLISSKKSLLEDSMLIVENSQELLVKTGGNAQDNIFSDLNRFNNDTNAYNYNNNYSGMDDKKNPDSSHIIEKKEPKFQKIKNTYFSDSYLFYKFKNEVSKNGFKRFEI